MPCKSLIIDACISKYLIYMAFLCWLKNDQFNKRRDQVGAKRCGTPLIHKVPQIL